MPSPLPFPVPFPPLLGQLCACAGAWAESVKLDKNGRPLRGLSPWDQDPINKRVLARGMQTHPKDPLLALVFNRRLAMGVLPMLQARPWSMLAPFCCTGPCSDPCCPRAA
jgi:hypothetical protein